MKRFKVHLERQYVILIESEDEDSAIENVEQYVSGGLDSSNLETRKNYQFQFLDIKPLINEGMVIEEIDSDKELTLQARSS